MSKISLPENLCILPWVHVHINHSGNVFPCCRNKQTDSYGNLKNQSLESIWNEAPVKEIRKTFLNGITPESCKDCVAVEKLGTTSLRQTSNAQYHEKMDLIGLATKADGSVDFKSLSFIDIRFSNVCNLRCRTCEPQNSTAWYAESELIYNKLPPTEVLVPANTKEGIDKVLNLLTPNLQYIHFLGGEPLLHDQHYLLLEKLIQDQRTDVTLSYNTNMTKLQYKNWNVLELWKHFKNVRLSASLDGSGIQSDILRKGSSWDELVKNFRLIKLFAPHLKIKIFPALSVLNSFHITEALKSWVELKILTPKIEVQFNYVEGPTFYNAKILTLNERKNLKIHYEKFLQEVKMSIDPLVYKNIELELLKFLAWLGDDDVWISERSKFRKATQSLDQSRNENFEAAFPDLRDLIRGV